DRREPGRARVVRASVPGAAVVPEVLHRIDSPNDRGGELAERWENEVLGTEREGRPDLGGLLALEGRIDGQLALPLQRDALTVEAPGKNHPAQEVPELVVRESDVEVIGGGAVDRHQPERLGLLGHMPFTPSAATAESIGDGCER